MGQFERATFGAGCFWGVEAAFRELPGVVSTAVGYMGGRIANPSYREVCSDRSGHAEVVEIVFDPTAVSYDELLALFWSAHDPTQHHRQGPDVGSQYRSVVFVHDPVQAERAQASLDVEQRSGRHRKPIVTSIEPAGEFWMAEDYHQQYLEKRGLARCHI